VLWLAGLDIEQANAALLRKRCERITYSAY
jgi:hypothetical protein